MKVLGIDPSLNNTGFVLADLDMTTLEFKVSKMILSETSPTKVKSSRKNSDDLERARRHATTLTDLLKEADIVCAEIPVGSQSARAMASYGICIGLLATIETAMIQVTPSQVKEAAVGNKNASKQEMIDWAVNKHPEAMWLTRGGKVLNKNEHLADAVASIEAAMITEDFKSVIAMYKLVKAA